ncbi:uncharacterized protein LOC127711240 [Mytilus californianus]|uniref:uncharacterized protein LOC127711240 n=1 Tax=Mytilus californianus TaxID=6549 RepID=UPI0022476BF3|nr:uncharacterized protein LOC127711240 [Mytilus californianus]XP_052073191.1 uncharacterized protein LOC127711240 [Mytilus californianus]
MVLEIEDITLAISTCIIGLALLVSLYRLVKWTITGTSITLIPEGTIQIGHGCTIKISARIQKKSECDFRLYWQKIGSSNEAKNISFCNTIKYAGSKSKTLAPSLFINKAVKEDTGIYQLRYESLKEVVISRQIAVQVFGDTATNSISEGENNFLRYIMLCRLGRDCTLQFFRHLVKEKDLQNHLNSHKQFLEKICPKHEILVLFPQNSYVRSADFDFCLLYKLIRNTLNIGIPTDGWACEPKPGSISQMDDIERIRSHRNFSSHTSTHELPKQKFQTKWNDLSQAIIRLSCRNLTKEVKSLLQRTFDKHQQNEYNKFIREYMTEVQGEVGICRRAVNVVIKRVDSLEANVECVQQHLLDIEEKLPDDHIPPHIRRSQNEILGHWKLDNHVFIKETQGFCHTFNLVQTKNVVIILGGPGAGKTVTARCIALQLQEKGWEVVPVFTPEDLMKYRDIERQQVFLLDDFVGSFALNETMYDDIVRYKTLIFDSLEQKTKILLTCRKSVYNALTKLQDLCSVHVVDLESVENRFNIEEKRKILHKHCDAMCVPNVKYENISLENATFMFPVLCKLFACNKKYQTLGERFFRKPFEGLCMEFDKMQERNTDCYAALIICMITGNKLSINRLPASKIKDCIYDSCGLNRGTSDKKIKDALEQMVGTYVTKIDDCYSFIHDSLFDILAYHYGRFVKDFPNIIKYLPSNFISNKICFDSDETVDTFFVHKTEDQFYHIAEGLYKELQYVYLYEVFMARLLYHEPFVNAFLEMLNSKSYDSFKKVFLSVHENTPCENPDDIDDMVHNLLVDVAFFDFKEERYCIRAISWVVYFGHFRLLEYIMGRVHAEEGSYQAVFGNEKMEQTRLLVLCCYRNDEKMTRLLLDHIDLDCINENLLTNNIVKTVSNAHRCHTPLTVACRSGNLPIVKLLVQSGAEIDENDPNKLSPLSVAYYYGNIRIVNFLLNNSTSQSTYLTMEQPINEHTVRIITYRSEDWPSITVTIQSRTHLSDDDQFIVWADRYRNKKIKRGGYEAERSKSHKVDEATQERKSKMVRWAEREFDNKSKLNFRKNSQGNSYIATKTTKHKTCTYQVDGDGNMRYLVRGNRRGNSRKRKPKEPKPKHSAAKVVREYSC